MIDLFFAYTILFLEILGVGVIIAGVLSGIFHALLQYKKSKKHIYEHIRKEIGHAILLGLEILIAVDIIKTVTTDLTLESVINLGIIVLIRTFLAFALEIEIDRVIPWKQKNTPSKK